jgi:hypothetical protein
LDRAPSNITQASGPSIQASKQTRTTKNRYSKQKESFKRAYKKFENAKKRRERLGRVVGSYDSGAPSKKNAEIKLRFHFEQGLIEKKGWRMGTMMGHLMVSDRIEEK